MLKKQLKEEDLEKVSGGAADPHRTDVIRDYGYFHTNCGGSLMNVGDPFSNVYCKKCGESHFWSSDFAKENVLECFNGYKIIIFYKGSTNYDEIKERQPRPSYLD